MSLERLRENILNETPDAEDFGAVEGSFVLNATLVAWNIAGTIGEGENSHIVEAMGYAESALCMRVHT